MIPLSSSTTNDQCSSGGRDAVGHTDEQGVELILGRTVDKVALQPIEQNLGLRGQKAGIGIPVPMGIVALLEGAGRE